MSIPSKKNRNSSSSKPENTVNEPEAAYKKTITFFNSFDEMENDQLKYFASLSPEELLQNHKKMSLASFGLKEETFSNKSERKIKFNKEQ